MGDERLVVVSDGSGWRVNDPAGRPLSSLLRTQAAAVAFATERLGDAGGGQVTVQGRDGGVRRTLTVEASSASTSEPTPVAPTAFCGRCGTELVADSRFCGACGMPTGGGAALAETASAMSSPPGAPGPLPAWLTGDWVAAGLLAVGQLLGLVLICTVYGMLLGVVASGTDGILPGLALGIVLPIATYGGEVLALVGSEDGNLVLIQDSLPVLLTGLAFGMSYVAMRWGVGRLRSEPRRAAALIVKASLLLAILLAIAGSFADVGDLADVSTKFTIITSASQLHAAFVALVVSGLAGALAMRRAGVRLLRAGRVPRVAARLTRAAGAGLLAWGALVLVLGIVTTIGLGVAADRTRDRGTVALASPLLLGGAGVGASAVAHGGAAGYATQEQFEDRESESEDPESLRLSSVDEREGHVSLVDWTLPLEETSRSTPWWGYALLAGPLIALVGGCLLLLRRATPPTESWAVGLSAALGLGYVLASWILSPLIGLSIAGRGTELAWDFPVLVINASAGSTLGLPLLWAIALCPVTGFVWARRRRLPGSIFGALAASTALTASGGDSPANPTLGRFCPSCGTAVTQDTAYCGTCGTALASERPAARG